jgi:exonuclease III
MVNGVNTQTKSVAFHHHYTMISKNPELQNNNTSITQNNPNNNYNSLTIFHQNVRGLSRKSDELLQSIHSSNSQVLCFCEHHMSLDEINSFHLNQYILGSQFCRHNFKHGGVAIFISTDLQFSTVDLSNYVKEKDLEICAIKIKIEKSITIVAYT